MATETLRLLLPRMSEERESAMIQAVGAVAGTERPSLSKVVKHLEQAEDPAWKNTGAVMRSISEMRLARLCFAPSVGQQIDAEGWTTVFTLAGLTLPDANTSRIAVGLPLTTPWYGFTYFLPACSPGCARGRSLKASGCLSW